jgi:hypothetical protein
MAARWKRATATYAYEARQPSRTAELAAALAYEATADDEAPDVGPPAYPSPMATGPRDPVPLDLAAVPDDAVRALWRAMTRRGHDVDMEDARLFAALVMAAAKPDPASR